MRRIYLNEDNAHFYANHPSTDMTVEGLQRLVDTYTRGTQVAGIMFCVNVRRALFASEAWEPLYVDYDPDAGPDQPCLAWLAPGDRELRLGSQGRQWVHNLWLLRERGIDHPQVWLDRCRQHGVEGWLSMRMNDCHYTAIGDAFWHSTLWKTRPELRRAPYRAEGGLEMAFDYGHPEVREHHLALIRELFARYDMTGLELDWMRWGMYFAPGREQAGLGQMTDFVRQVHALAQGSAERVGHPVKVAVRVPAEPSSCLSLGLDVLTWAAEGLVDTVILSSFLGCANLDYPIAIWRRLLGPGIRLLAHAESCVDPYPAPDVQVLSYEVLYGAAASALQRGADGIYLFNECYRESDEPLVLAHLLTHAGSLETLAKVARRQVVSYPQVHAPGESDRTVLPIPLQVADQPGVYVRKRKDFGRMARNVTLRIATGTVEGVCQAALRLGFSHDTPPDLGEELTVRLNGVVLAPALPPRYQDLAHDWKVRHGWPNDGFPGTVGQVLSYGVPLAALQSDVNVVEFEPPSGQGSLEWAEILLLPTSTV